MTSFNYDRPPLGHWGNFAGALLCLAVIALIAFGCEHPDKHYDPAQGGFVSSSSSGAAATTSTTTQPVAATGGATAAASDPLPPGKVAWCYGGFDGSHARHDARCRISSLRVSNPSGLTFKWNSGVPGDWANTGGLVVFALFFQATDGSWKGGKIDWINAARSSRDLKNPAAGYGGWDWNEYLVAKKHAAVIVSADGKKRSNWIFD